MATQMNIQDCNPLEARQAFNSRLRKHIGAGLLVFIPLCFGLMWVLNPWIAALLAFLPASALYYYLESRLIVIECPSCQRDINTNTPWECGFKKCHNENTDYFPFIRECEHCGYEPKAYICHHCGKPIYLTSDRQALHAAKRLEFPEFAPPPVRTVVLDPTKDKELAQKMEKRDLLHQLDVTEIKKKIELIEKIPANAPAPKSFEQELEDEIAKGVGQGMALFEIEQRLKANADAKYANDEHKRDQAHALIEREILRRMS